MAAAFLKYSGAIVADRYVAAVGLNEQVTPVLTSPLLATRLMHRCSPSVNIVFNIEHTYWTLIADNTACRGCSPSGGGQATRRKTLTSRKGVLEEDRMAQPP